MPNCSLSVYASHSPDCQATSYPGADGAAVLFAFSFVWPHVKLLLLHVFYYLRLSPGVRRNALYWFAFFGKWSLADVLVMAVIIGLFNLQLDTSYLELWEQLKDHDFNSTCVELCRTNTSQFHDMSKCQSGCSAIEDIANRAFTASIFPESNLFLELRLQGLGAVYAFCVAVLLSLSIGVYVDHLDDCLLDDLRKEHLAHKRRHPNKRMAVDNMQSASAAEGGGSTALPTLLESTSGSTLAMPLVAPAPSAAAPGHRRLQSFGVGNNLGPAPAGAPPGHRRLQSDGSHSVVSVQSVHSIQSEMSVMSTQSDAPLLVEAWITEDNIDMRYLLPTDEIDTRFGTNQPCCTTRAWLVHLAHVLMTTALLMLLLCMQFSSSFQRKVTGGMPTLLREAGIDFDTSLTLWDLPAMTAAEGGLDYLMAVTFVIFVLIGPLVRVISLLCLLLLPLQLETQRSIFLWSRRLVAYTGVEVMVIATPLIGEAFGPISQSLLNPQILPPCRPVIDLYHPYDNRCLRIDIYPMMGYWFNVAAVVVLCLAGFDGSLTSKYIHRRLWPHDPHPPPSCVECCARTKGASRANVAR